MKEWQDRAHALLDELLAVAGAHIDLDNPKPPVTIAVHKLYTIRREAFAQGFVAARNPKTPLETLLVCAEADAAYTAWRTHR